MRGAIVQLVIFLAALSGGSAITEDSIEAQDDDAIAHGYKQQPPMTVDANSPWLSGPLEKKYQFHIGQQSWLAAREMCLGQNSDLVTITSADELEWILSHYKPQFPHSRERQIQVGLLADMTERTQKEWTWVDKTPFNESILQWTSGEPFDHANGKERCALLNINERKLDDVDCELSGTPVRFYRFVCERTHERHMKHEEVNNPLWKRLGDVLTFFGISSESSTTAGVTNSQVEIDDAENYTQSASTSTTSAAQGSPAADSSTASLLELSTESATEGSVTSDSSTARAEELATSTSQQKLEADVEGISNAVSVLHAAKTVNSTGDEPLFDESLERFNGTTELQDVDNNNVYIETASVETARTTKADPLASLADNIEKTVASVAEPVASSSVDDKDALESKMRHLERIITAVQRMIDPGASAAAAILGKEDDTNSTELLTEASSAEWQNFGGDLSDEEEAPGSGNSETTLSPEPDFIRHQKNVTDQHTDAPADLILSKQTEDVAGHCGDDNDGLAPHEAKSQRIEKFLRILRAFLNRSSSRDLKTLVDAGQSDKRPLLDRLEEAVAGAEKQAELPQASTIQPEAVDEEKNTASTEERWKAEEMRNKIEKQIVRELDELREVESQEAAFWDSDEKDQHERNSTQRETTRSAAEAAALIMKLSASSTPGPEKSKNSFDSVNSFVTQAPTDGTIRVDKEPAIGAGATGSSNSTGGANDKDADPEGFDNKVELKLPQLLNINATSASQAPEAIETTATTSSTLNDASVVPTIDQTSSTKQSPTTPDQPSPTTRLAKLSAPRKSNKPTKKGMEKIDIGNEAKSSKGSRKRSQADDDGKHASQQTTNHADTEPNVHNALTEIEDPTSVFPRPRFDLLKPHELEEIPAPVRQRISEEKKRVDAAYDAFQNNVDTDKLIKRIQWAERMLQLESGNLDSSSDSVEN